MIQPDCRFRGRISVCDGYLKWELIDLRRGRVIAWGEEFHWALAVESATEAVAAARTWHMVKRPKSEQYRPEGLS
jgi:hypothetical protein